MVLSAKQISWLYLALGSTKLVRWMVDLHFALMDQVEKRVWISETITGVGPVDVAGLTLQF